LDYLYGSLLALGVLVFLLAPYFMRYLLEDVVETEADQETAVSNQAAMNQV